MRLVVTRCRLCEKITDAKHAETINDLEQISSFIQEKRRIHHSLSILGNGHSADLIRWCNCHESKASAAH